MKIVEVCECLRHWYGPPAKDAFIGHQKQLEQPDPSNEEVWRTYVRAIAQQEVDTIAEEQGEDWNNEGGEAVGLDDDDVDVIEDLSEAEDVPIISIQKGLELQGLEGVDGWSEASLHSTPLQ